MKAAVYRKFGPPEVVVIEDVAKPAPKSDEVLIRIHAAAVSIADHRLRAMDLPKGMGYMGPLALGVFRPRKPILGMDGAGVVESIGSSVTKFKIGDEVIFMPGRAMGCHAEYAVIAESGVITLKPENLNFVDSASILFGGLTSLHYLQRKPVVAGDSVLVNGASGACGTAAVQLAKHMGAEVTGVCSGKNADLVRRLGADHVIDYTQEDFAKNGKQYDAIIECVGNAPFARVENSIKPGGALLLVIFSDLKAMLFAKRQSRKSGKLVTAADWRPEAEKAAYLVDLVEQGIFKPVVDRTFPFDQIVEAHRYVDTGRKVGNVIVTMT